MTVAFLISTLLFSMAIDSGQATLLTDSKQGKVLAQVGPYQITAEAFRLNYEFGFPFLKSGSNSDERKKKYLDYMIYEKLLAIKADSLGLTQSPHFKSSWARLQKSIILENLINLEIKQKVEVSFDEVKEMVNQSHTWVKLVLIPETSLEGALAIKHLLDDVPLDQAMNLMRDEHPDVLIRPDEFETDFIPASELPPEILQVTQNLQIGQLSEPFQFGDYFFIAGVKNIQRKGITDLTYANQYPTLRKVIFARKVQERLSVFVDSLLSPLYVRTSKQALLELVTLIRAADLNRIENASDLTDYLHHSIETAAITGDLVVVRTNDHHFTLREIIEFLNIEMIPLEKVHAEEFPVLLSEIIGLSMRDFYLMQYADKINLSSNPDVQSQLLHWKTKLSFDMYKQSVSDSVNQLSAFKSLLVTDAEKMKSSLPVVINDEVLDSIAVTESPKSDHFFTPVFVSGINRMAQPIVDGVWK